MKELTQEDKELLMQDLCARLPYGVKYQDRIEGGIHILSLGIIHHYERFIPYLRPMSSMTEKEREQLYFAIDFYGKIDKDGDIDASHHEFVFSETCRDYIDYLIAHHFDYRGLIPMGLALEAQEGMYNNQK